MNKKITFKMLLFLVFISTVIYRGIELCSEDYFKGQKQPENPQKEVVKVEDVEPLEEYATVNMLPHQYQGFDEQIEDKCTYNYNCVFVPPDSNLRQFQEFTIDNMTYTVIEKTSNCNRYYNQSGTYDRSTNCIEFWDNSEFNKNVVYL